MGHSDIGVSMNTYTHLGLEDSQNEMVRLEELNRAKEEVAKAAGEKKPVTQRSFRAVWYGKNERPADHDSQQFFCDKILTDVVEKQVVPAQNRSSLFSQFRLRFDYFWFGLGCCLLVMVSKNISIFGVCQSWNETICSKNEAKGASEPCIKGIWLYLYRSIYIKV